MLLRTAYWAPFVWTKCGMPIFYIYAFLDPRKPGKYSYGSHSFDFEPFYIGKGKNDRAEVHLKSIIRGEDYNKHKSNVIRKIVKESQQNPIIVRVVTDLEEEEALEKEKEIIKLIGRADLKQGPLTNKADGGEGATGKIMTEEYRRKISAAKTGMTYDKIYDDPEAEKEKRRQIMLGENNPMFGRSHKEDTKQRMSLSKKKLVKEQGFWSTPGYLHVQGKTYEEIYGVEEAARQREKRSQSHKGKKHPWAEGKSLSKSTKESIRNVVSKNYPYEVIGPDGIVERVEGLKQFCTQHNISYGCMLLVSKGKQKHHKGWKCRRLY